MTKALSIVYYRDKFYAKISGSIATIKHHFRFKMSVVVVAEKTLGGNQTLFNLESGETVRLQDKAVELAVRRVPEVAAAAEITSGTVSRSAGQAGRCVRGTFPVQSESDSGSPCPLQVPICERGIGSVMSTPNSTTQSCMS